MVSQLPPHIEEDDFVSTIPGPFKGSIVSATFTPGKIFKDETKPIIHATCLIVFESSVVAAEFIEGYNGREIEDAEGKMFNVVAAIAEKGETTKNKSRKASVLVLAPHDLPGMSYESTDA